MKDSEHQMTAQEPSRRRARYGAYTTSDRVELAVQIRATDFNGESFDGSPFSVTPDWLIESVKNKAIMPNVRRHTDYADWDVVLGAGQGIATAQPGDWIVRRENGDLAVVAEPDAFILINLRPPVMGEMENLK